MLRQTRGKRDRLALIETDEGRIGVASKVIDPNPAGRRIAERDSWQGQCRLLDSQPNQDRKSPPHRQSIPRPTSPASLTAIGENSSYARDWQGPEQPLRTTDEGQSDCESTPRAHLSPDRREPRPIHHTNFRLRESLQFAIYLLFDTVMMMRGLITKYGYVLSILLAAIVVIWAIQENSEESEGPISAGILPLQVEIISGPPIKIDHPILIDFWATWCAPCRDSIPHLNGIFAKYQGRGLQVIGITSEDEQTVSRSLKQLPIDYSVALDPSQRYFYQFRISGIPHLVLIDADGGILWRGHPLQFPERILARVLDDAG